jgi:hypothetical protein
MTATYSIAFWERALELASIGYKQCEQCKGYTIRKGEGRKTVRIVLTEAGKPMPHKLRLLCTVCFPDAREIKVPRRLILAKIADLPFPEPDKAKTVNGR